MFLLQALRLKINSFDQNTVGRIVSLISNDIMARFDMAFVYMPYLFVGPLETVIITYILWQELGAPSALLGIGTILFFVPFQGSYKSD